jgi:hypothetical protein
MLGFIRRSSLFDALNLVSEDNASLSDAQSTETVPCHLNAQSGLQEKVSLFLMFDLIYKRQLLFI